MLVETKNLKKITDIINSEGCILGLYKNGEVLILSSHLMDIGGDVFYTTTGELLRHYLNGDITLNQLFMLSEDILVTRKLASEKTTHVKADLVSRITFGEEYYTNISYGMKNKNILSYL
jgi:hypothetical protein